MKPTSTSPVPPSPALNTSTQGGKKQLAITLTGVFILLFFAGCEEDSPASLAFNSPKVSVVSGPSFSVDPTFHNYTVDMTVVNNGDGPTAFNIGYSIKLKRGDYIVDWRTLTFGTLRHRESTSSSLWFTKAKSGNDYDHIEAVLYWYDAENTYYTN